MDLGISGKTALVMGASRGIGRAVAAALAGEGARVAMASRSRERLEAVAAEVEGETAVFSADTAGPGRPGGVAGGGGKGPGPGGVVGPQNRGPPPRGGGGHPP